MEKFKNLINENAKIVRNIYNQKEIENFLNLIIDNKNISEPSIENWIKHNVRNYIIKQRPIQLIESLNEVMENWAIEGVKNKTLSKVILDNEFKDEILHVIDYLRIEYENKDLTRLTVPEAIKQSIEWVKNQKKVEDDMSGRVKFMNCENGYSIVEITSKQALEYEGYQMNHCVGYYYVKPMLQKLNRVFSLRDENNIPHVTILYDVNSETIKEIKGNSNNKVKPEYQKELIKFFNNFNFRKMNDYDYIPNIDYNAKSFVFYTDQKKTSSNKKHMNIFEYDKIRVNHYIETNFPEKVIKESVYLIEITKCQESIFDKIFLFLNIKNINNLDLKIINKINAKSLEIKNIENSLGVIENNNIEALRINNKIKKVCIAEIKSNSVRKVIIEPEQQLTIDKLDFSEALYLTELSISNCIVKEIILPSNIANIRVINSEIQKINKSNIGNLYLKDSQINNDDIVCKKLYCFNSLLNESNILESVLSMSDKELNINTLNSINNKQVKIVAPDLLKDDLSPGYKEDKVIFIPQIFNYPTLPFSIDKLKDRMVMICKEEYKYDIRVLCDRVNLQFRFFEYLKYMDVNYITQKGNNGESNEIIFKKEFAQYLRREGALEELFLFENLRMLSPYGLNIDNFSKLIKKEPHEFIKKLAEKIQDDPGYLLNGDSSKILGGNGKWNMEKFYVKMKEYFINEENLYSKGKLFKTKLMSDYWEQCKNKEISESLKQEFNMSNEKTAKILEIENVFLDVQKVFDILDNKELELSNDNKKDILFKFFDDCPIEFDSSNAQEDKIFHETYNIIYKHDKHDMLSRDDLIDGYIKYVSMKKQNTNTKKVENK